MQNSQDKRTSNEASVKQFLYNSDMRRKVTMKHLSNSKNTDKVNEQTIDKRQAIELSETELEQVSGSCGGGCWCPPCYPSYGCCGGYGCGGYGCGGYGCYPGCGYGCGYRGCW